MWQRIVREGLSVRKVEDLVNSIYRKSGGKEEPKRKSTPARSSTPYLEELSQKLRPIYGTKVHISASKDGKGNITFDFYSEEDLQRLLDLLLKP